MDFVVPNGGFFFYDVADVDRSRVFATLVALVVAVTGQQNGGQLRPFDGGPSAYRGEHETPVGQPFRRAPDELDSPYSRDQKKYDQYQRIKPTQSCVTRYKK